MQESRILAGEEDAYCESEANDGDAVAYGGRFFFLLHGGVRWGCQVVRREVESYGRKKEKALGETIKRRIVRGRSCASVLVIFLLSHSLTNPRSQDMQLIL